MFMGNTQLQNVIFRFEIEVYASSYELRKIFVINFFHFFIFSYNFNLNFKNHWEMEHSIVHIAPCAISFLPWRNEMQTEARAFRRLRAIAESIR